MELQRFYPHFILVLAVCIAGGVSEIVSGGEGPGGSGGRGNLPPDRESSSPLRGPSTVPQHMPSTGQIDETKTKKGTDQNKPELSAPDPGTSAPRKHPSSHAEKHPDSDRMDSQQQKTQEKESH